MRKKTEQKKKKIRRTRLRREKPVETWEEINYEVRRREDGGRGGLAMRGFHFTFFYEQVFTLHVL